MKCKLHNDFCHRCGSKELKYNGFCSTKCLMLFKLWCFWWPIQKWFKAPISCKIGRHKINKTNIGYDIGARKVDFFCTKCDKKVLTTPLDDAGNIPEVMELMKWAKNND